MSRAHGRCVGIYFANVNVRVNAIVGVDVHVNGNVKTNERKTLKPLLLNALYVATSLNVRLSNFGTHFAVKNSRAQELMQQGEQMHQQSLQGGFPHGMF